MSKDPAVLFYTSDFISGTITMTDEQRGKYILLLCVQHQKGGLTEKDMLNICKTYDIDIWSKFKKIDGLYYNERMKVESEKRSKYSKSRRDNRLSKDLTDSNKNNISLTYVPHMENENEDINNNKGVENFDCPEYLKKSIEKWIKYKKQKGIDLVPLVTETIALTLHRLSKGKEIEAMKIIDYNIKNNYESIYEPKKDLSIKDSAPLKML